LQDSAFRRLLSSRVAPHLRPPTPPQWPLLLARHLHLANESAHRKLLRLRNEIVSGRPVQVITLTDIISAVVKAVRGTHCNLQQ
jgi:hypothetical protein